MIVNGNAGCGDLRVLPRGRQQIDRGLRTGQCADGEHGFSKLLRERVGEAGGFVCDADLGKIGQLARLKRLHLEGNDISDAGVPALAAFKAIEYLNLYGNSRVTDASVDRLAAMSALKRIYLSSTGITPNGLKRLRAARAAKLTAAG